VPQLLDAARPAPAPSRRFRWWWAALAVGAVLIALNAHRLSAGPGHVPPLTVVNPTDYVVTVSVSGNSHGATSQLTTVSRHASDTVAEVLDQGSTWTFHFSAQGHDAGVLTISRGDLSRSGWTLRIPQSVEAMLKSEGVPLSPI
jgi:hypothetical protein